MVLWEIKFAQKKRWQILYPSIHYHLWNWFFYCFSSSSGLWDTLIHAGDQIWQKVSLLVQSQNSKFSCLILYAGVGGGQERGENRVNAVLGNRALSLTKQLLCITEFMLLFIMWTAEIKPKLILQYLSIKKFPKYPHMRLNIQGRLAFLSSWYQCVESL